MGKRDRAKLADLESRDGSPPAGAKRQRTDGSKVELAPGETHPDLPVQASRDHAGIADFETLPEELCRQIMLACDWKTVIAGLNLTSKKWNRIVSERIFQSLSICFSEEGTIAHKSSIVAALSNNQLRNIQNYTRRLGVKCGKSRQSQDKALELARGVNPNRCISLDIVPHHAFHEEVYAEAIRIATTMPKLMRMTLPAVFPVAEAHDTVQPERLYLEGALTFKVGQKQSRELVCDINKKDQLALGTPKTGVFRLISTGSEKDSKRLPTKTNMVAMQLKSNGIVPSDLFRRFMGDLGFGENRCEEVTKLEVFDTSIVGQLPTISTNLRSLGIRNLKILRVRKCRDPTWLLYYIVQEAQQSHRLNLNTIDIAGEWDSAAFEEVEQLLYMLWEHCPYVSDLTFESNRTFSLLDLLPVLRTHGHALRRLKYRVGPNVEFRQYFWVFYHCRSLEEFEFDMPQLQSRNGRDIFTPFLIGKSSEFAEAIALHGTTALHTLHMHLPLASFRRMASDRKQSAHLKACLTDITNFNAKALTESKAKINLRTWAWTIYGAKGSQTKRFVRVQKKVAGSDSQEDRWVHTSL
ncbi:hypothetical protein SLS60_011043 [Paraconiothyrium brasiliense]|uniref:F-box domain-containing protein n=1 Tax=Paraconiothyrium brasiliense TaxID=300254 RepID=A0ABR3QKF3_9PLEO